MLLTKGCLSACEEGTGHRRYRKISSRRELLVGETTFATLKRSWLRKDLFVTLRHGMDFLKALAEPLFFYQQRSCLRFRARLDANWIMFIRFEWIQVRVGRVKCNLTLQWPHLSSRLSSPPSQRGNRGKESFCNKICSPRRGGIMDVLFKLEVRWKIYSLDESRKWS